MAAELNAEVVPDENCQEQEEEEEAVMVNDVASSGQNNNPKNKNRKNKKSDSIWDFFPGWRMPFLEEERRGRRATQHTRVSDAQYY